MKIKIPARPFSALVALAFFLRCGGYGLAADTPPQLKTARAVPVQFYLALPNGWTPDTTWPILVTLDGTGHNFLHNCQIFTRARGDLPFIVVTPCVRSNGNDPADQAAVLAIVREVQKDPYRKYFDEQWDTVSQLAHDHGYRNLSRTIVPEASHNAFPRQVIAFFSTLLPRP